MTTSKIKQKFFKTFGIPKRFYTEINIGDLDFNYVESSADTLEELFENCDGYFDEYIEDIKDFHDYEEKYPEITSDIVLELEEIILNCDYSLTKVPNHSYELDDLYCWFDTTNLERKNITGKTRESITLKMCVQLKDEIQNDIKELFNVK